MSIHPTFRYDDPRAAIDFLTGALGFRELTCHTDDAGRVAHAELGWTDGVEDGPVTGVLALGTRGDADPFDTGRAVTYLTCDDPDALHDRAVTAGATVAMGLTDQDYGSREFAISDPEGNAWCLGTYRMGG
ncbi:VOC family protein [Pseudonocardia sp. C8]|uniref:VOC family protein n=1 Tax=Pseudonocardia sp. C8 TaxID=2762759 RepID=UPI001642A79C|nr:VOC family protein [Pseudonocardia sp. C8]MBC3192650.1 VOC family protein [Pseudonocardia sp. C8]